MKSRTPESAFVRQLHSTALGTGDCNEAMLFVGGVLLPLIGIAGFERSILGGALGVAVAMLCILGGLGVGRHCRRQLKRRGSSQHADAREV